MTFTSGERVRIRRTSSANQRYGDVGQVVSTGRSQTGATYHVRLERYFSRSRIQRERGYDFTLYENQLESAPAAPEPAPTLALAVGQRVRLRDGRVTLANHAVMVDPGTEVQITSLNHDWQTADHGFAIDIRTDDRREYGVYRDQIEPVAAPTPATEWVAATAENAVVGARIRYVNPHAGDVVHVNDEGVLARVSDTSVFIRMDSPRNGKFLVGAGETAYHWSAQLSDIEVAVPASTAPAWVDATEANAVEGARIRYRRTVGNVVTENDEGVIAARGVGADSVTRYIRMDTPRPGAGALSGTGDRAFHFTVSLSDIQVQVSATTSTASAETAPSTPTVTFTPEQAALIKRVAERYTRDHGFNALAADVFAALGINDAPASKKLRFTVEYEVDVLPAVDGAELPNSASAAIVDATARAASITGLLSESVRPVAGTIEAAVSRIRYID